MQKILSFGRLCFWASLFLFNSCDFLDPIKDKTGNIIPIISLDLPEFDANYKISMTELNSEEIPPYTVELRIGGEYAENEGIVTDLGYLNRSFSLEGEKKLFLYLNPNMKVSEAHPVTFHVSGINTHCAVLPFYVEQKVSGEKRIDLDVLPLNQLDRFPVDESNRAISVFRNGVESLPVAQINGANGIGYEYVYVYKADQDGCYSIGYDEKIYESAGLVDLNPSQDITPGQNLYLNAGDYFVCAAKSKGMMKGSVVLNLNSDKKQYASFEYVIKAGDKTYKGVINGQLPIRRVVEQIYVPVSDPKAEIDIIPVPPFEVAEQKIEIPDITSEANKAAYDVSVNESVEKKLYEIRMLAFCPTKKEFSLALTKEFEIREGDTDEGNVGKWITYTMTQGKTSVYLTPNKLHTIRFYMDNEKFEYDITTDPAAADDFLGESLQKLEVKERPDNAVDMYIEVSNYRICDFVQ